jgi:PP-loop superfamily ATP-utilizing enzyme
VDDGKTTLTPNRSAFATLSAKIAISGIFSGGVDSAAVAAVLIHRANASS